MARKPEIQIDALLNFLLDENELKKALKPAIGSALREAASGADIGASLLPADQQRALREQLRDTFKGAAGDFGKLLGRIGSGMGEELGDAAKLSIKEALSEMTAALERTRRDTIKKFDNDYNALISGQGRAKTSTLKALPSLDKDTIEWLQRAERLFGRQALRTGSFESVSENDIKQGMKRYSALAQAMHELAGLPDINKKDFNSLRRVTGAADPRREWMDLPDAQRQNLTKVGRALELQAKTVDKLVSGFHQAGFGDLASEFMASSKAQRTLASNFNRLIAPDQLSRQERKATEAQERVQKATLKEEARRRERERKVTDTFQRAGFSTPVNPSKPGPGLLATMDPSDRAAGGYKARSEYRQAALDRIKADNQQKLREQERYQKAQEAWDIEQARHMNRQRDAGLRAQAADQARVQESLGAMDLRDRTGTRADPLREVRAAIDTGRVKAAEQQARTQEAWARAQAQDEDRRRTRQARDQEAWTRAQAQDENRKRAQQAADQAKLQAALGAMEQRERSGGRADPLLDVQRQIGAARVQAADKAQQAMLTQSAKDSEKLQAVLGAMERAAREGTRRDPLEEVRRQIASAQVKAAEANSRAAGAPNLGAAQRAESDRILGRVGGIGSLTSPEDIKAVRTGLNAELNERLKAAKAAENLHGKESAEYAAALSELEDVKRRRLSLYARQQELTAAEQSAIQQQRQRDQQLQDQQRRARRETGYDQAQQQIRRAGGIGNIFDVTTLGDISRGVNAQLKRVSEELNVIRRTGDVSSAEYRRLEEQMRQLQNQRSDIGAQLRVIRTQNAPVPMDGGERLMQQFGRYAIGYGSLYQLLGLIGQLKTEIIELDKAWFSIKAVTQATDVEMKSISRSIRDVALSTNFSTREIAAATEVLGQAGVAPADMDKVLSATARFASATASDLKVSADLLTTLRQVFKTMDEGVISDQLTRALNLSKLSAEDLKTILSLTSQTAASYNVNLEQLLAASTTMRNAGIKPSTVATGLRQAMLEMFNPDTATMKALQKRYAEMGEKVAGQAITPEQITQRFFGFSNAQNPLLAALTELKRMGFTDEGQKTLQRGVDIRAFNAIQALLQNFKELQGAESKITFGQAAIEGADTQMKSLAATMENLGSSVVVLAEQMSNGLVRTLQSGAEEATNLIEKLTELDLQVKASGQGDALQGAGLGALGGALAGASAGKGFKGKLLGGAIGAVGGAWVGGGSQLDAADGVGVGDIAGAAASLFMVWKAGKWLMEAGAALAPAAKMLGAGAGAAALQGAGAAAAGKLGLRFVPVVGWLITAVSILDSLVDLFPESEAAKLRNQAEAASGLAAKARKKLEENSALVEAYDPNARNPKEGTASAGWQTYRTQLDNFQSALTDTFGQMTSEESQQVTALVKEYASTSFSGRAAVRQRIEQTLGKPLGDQIGDKVLFDLGVQRQEMEATVNSYVENTNQMLTAVTDRIRAARESGGSISEKDLAFSDAFSKNSDQLMSILNGTSGLSPEAIQEKLKQLYTDFVEIVDHRPALALEERNSQMTALANQLAGALSSANNAAEIEMAVHQIGNSLEFIGLTAEEHLKSIQDGLDRAMQAAQKEQQDLQSSLSGDNPDMLNRATNWVWRNVFRSPNVVGEQRVADYEARQAANAARIEGIQKQRQLAQANYEAAKAKQAQNDAEIKANVYANTGNLVSSYSARPGINAALQDQNILNELKFSAEQRRWLAQNREGLVNQDPALIDRISTLELDAKTGRQVPSQEYQMLEKVTTVITSGLERVSKDQERRQRDEKLMVGEDLYAKKYGAQAAVTKADANKNYALLASNSPDNPILQQRAAEREILVKELAQAQAAAADAKDDKKANAVPLAERALQKKAELDTWDLQTSAELDKYKEKLKSQAERIQRKADEEAKKQARIAITQTAIEQRIVKQNFDEAVAKGDQGGFLKYSKEYEAVQAKLIEQLKEELTAKGYTLEQIQAEIELRNDLNKPLAEQVQNINKLSDQVQQNRELKYQELGTGPKVGDRINTAYLGAEGFTIAEQTASNLSDLQGYGAKRLEILQQMANPTFQKSEEAMGKLNKELRDVETKIGEITYQTEQMGQSAADGIYGAFDPRSLTLALEQTSYTASQLGNNLRDGLVSSLDAAGDALARMVAEGGSFTKVLGQIMQQMAAEQLANIFKTNLREGAGALLEMASGGPKEGQQSRMSQWGHNFFGFGSLFGGADKEGAANGSKGGFLSSLFGGGGAAGAVGDAASSVGSMVVNAGSVTVMGGGGGKAASSLESMLGGGGKAGSSADFVGPLPEGATAAEGGFFSGLTDKITGMFSGITDKVSGIFGGLGETISGLFSGAGSWLSGLFGGGGGGGGLLSSLGSLFGGGGGGGGSSWISGLLSGGMAMFGLASGGSIDRKGRVLGSGRKGVDSVPVRVKGTGAMGLLAPGESVLNVRATEALGSDWVDAANSGKLFRRAVGGAVSESYNASRRASASAANSVAASSGGKGEAPTVNLKTVNVFDKSAMLSAMQTEEGQQLMVNILKKRGALD